MASGQQKKEQILKLRVTSAQYGLQHTAPKVILMPQGFQNSYLEDGLSWQSDGAPFGNHNQMETII